VSQNKTEITEVFLHLMGIAQVLEETHEKIPNFHPK
jgi:hypothetical protein